MRKILITILSLTSLHVATSQTSVSFQHLGNATFQNSYINPALIPEGKIFIGLPVLSGVHFHVNNKLGYNDIFTRDGNTTLVNVDKMLGNLQNQNIFMSQVNVNILHFGYKHKSGSLFSFTVNERVEMDFLYPKEMVDYLWNGNRSFLNEDVRVSRAGVRGSHFREFGLGFASPVNERLTVGIRGKFLVGFANVSTPGNFNATLRSNGEAFQLSADWQNASFRTSGLDIYEGNEGDLGSHLVMNSNTGFAVDLGGTYHLNRYYTFTGSLVDIGFINWNENIENEALNDTTFTYNGVNVDELGDVRQTLEDSLINRFDPTENNDAYRTWLPLRAHASWIYHYNPQTDFYFTGGARLVQRQIKMLYGGGVTRKFGRAFTGSISVTKLPQHFLNLGAAFAAKAGPVQLYMAADQVINFDATEAKSFDFRMGFNFVFNEREGSSRRRGGGFASGPISTGARGLDTNVFLGKKVKTKKREGIYSIIRKQKRRELRNKRTKRSNDVKKKSLNGRSGQKKND